MDYREIHRKLDWWSEARTFQELVKIVHKSESDTSNQKQISINKTSQVIKTFINKYSGQLFTDDIPALSRLYLLITLSKKSNNCSPKLLRNLSKLEIVFAKAIFSANHNKTALADLPPVLNSIIESYLPLPYVINRTIIDQPSPNPLTFSLMKIKEFVADLRDLTSRQEFDIFNQMATTFFRHSSMENQEQFFEFLQRSILLNLDPQVEWEPFHSDLPDYDHVSSRKARIQIDVDSKTGYSGFRNNAETKLAVEITKNLLRCISNDSPHLNFAPLIFRYHTTISAIIKN